MNYTFSPRSSISEEIEEDILAFSNGNTPRTVISKNEEDYYIQSKLQYTNSDISSSEENEESDDSGQITYETSKDRYNRSYSRLDFQNVEELQHSAMYKHYRLDKQQYDGLKAFYDSYKSDNGMFSVKLLNSLLTSKKFNLNIFLHVIYRSFKDISK